MFFLLRVLVLVGMMAAVIWLSPLIAHMATEILKTFVESVGP